MTDATEDPFAGLTGLARLDIYIDRDGPDCLMIPLPLGLTLLDAYRYIHTVLGTTIRQTEHIVSHAISGDCEICRELKRGRN